MKRKSSVLLLLIMLLLTGCQANYESKFVIGKDGNTELTGTLEFSDEAAETVKENSELKAQIVEFLNSEIGGIPKIIEMENSIKFETKSKEQLTSKESIGLQLKNIEVDGGIMYITGDVIYPSKIKNAIKEAVKQEPDREALEAAMLESTKINLIINTPGKIKNINTEIDYDYIEKNSIQISQSLSSYQEGAIGIEAEIDGLSKEIIALFVTGFTVAIFYFLRRGKK